MSTILGDFRQTSLITEPTYLSPDDAVWGEDLCAAVVAPAPTRYTFASRSAVTLKITVAVSAATSATINLVVSKNVMVTKLLVGADATKENSDASRPHRVEARRQAGLQRVLNKHRNPAHRCRVTESDFNESQAFWRTVHFRATGPMVTTSAW
jgi:hypothetical protein